MQPKQRPVAAIMKDLRDAGELVQSYLAELEVANQALCQMFAGNVSVNGFQRPAEVEPDATPKEHTRKGRISGIPNKQQSRKITPQEKAQIRLLWEQSSRDRKAMLPELAKTYGITQQHVSAVLFHHMQNVHRRTASTPS